MHPDQPPPSSTVTARHARWVFRWQWPVLVVSPGLALPAGAGASCLGFIDEYRVFFGPDNPQLLAFDELENIYTQPTTGAFSTKGEMP